jgi:SAM-dependent methyltransferase
LIVKDCAQLVKVCFVISSTIAHLDEIGVQCSYCRHLIGSICLKLHFNLAYFHHPPWDTGITPPELIEFIDSHPPGRALDLGCGTGTNVIYLARHGWQVTGIDFARRAVHLALRKVRQLGLIADFRLGDVTHLDGLIGSYDLILDIGCLHNLDDPGRQAYLHHVKRLLAPGGTFLVYLILRQHPDDPGRGMLESHLTEITQQFTLQQRQDGTHNGSRRSAWLTLGHSL